MWLLLILFCQLRSFRTVTFVYLDSSKHSFSSVFRVFSIEDARFKLHIAVRQINSYDCDCCHYCFVSLGVYLNTFFLVYLDFSKHISVQSSESSSLSRMLGSNSISLSDPRQQLHKSKVYQYNRRKQLDSHTWINQTFPKIPSSKLHGYVVSTSTPQRY